MTYSDLKRQMMDFNEKHNIERKVDEKKNSNGQRIEMVGRIVIKQSSLRPDVQYSEAERTYEFDNYNKALTSSDLGYSIFSHCPVDNDCMRIENLRNADVERAEVVQIVE